MRHLLSCVLAVCCSVPPLLNAQIDAIATSSPGAHVAPIPDFRFYSLIFRHVLYLQENGEPSVAAGKVSPSIARFYSARVGATEDENTTLLAEALAWKSEVEPIDKRVHAIIDAIHAKTPGGRLAPGQQPPAVPAELIDLQAQRDNVTLKHVAKLKDHFGEARFLALDNNLHRSTHTSFKSGRVAPTATTGRSEAQ